LLCNDDEMGGCIRHVTGQRLGKHVSVATVTHATGETGCCLHGPRRGDMRERELGQPVQFIVGSQFCTCLLKEGPECEKLENLHF
jgi:hypothetical protein